MHAHLLCERLRSLESNSLPAATDSLRTHKLPSNTSMMQGYVQHFGMLNDTQMAMFDNQFFNMSAEEAAWRRGAKVAECLGG